MIVCVVVVVSLLRHGCFLFLKADKKGKNSWCLLSWRTSKRNPGGMLLSLPRKNRRLLRSAASLPDLIGSDPMRSGNEPGSLRAWCDKGWEKFYLSQFSQWAQSVGQSDMTEIVWNGDDGRKTDQITQGPVSNTYADVVRKGRDVQSGLDNGYWGYFPKK